MGNTLVLADGKHGITTWSIEDPDHPVQLGTFDIPKGRFSVYSDVKMRSDDRGTVYVSTEYGPLWAFDVQDPADPKPLWRSDLWQQPPDVRDFDVRGSTLVIGGMPVQVFDLHNPAEPVPLGEAGFMSFAVALTDGHIVTNNFLSGFAIFRFDGVNPPEYLETIEPPIIDPQAALWGTDDLVFISSPQMNWAVLDLDSRSGVEYSPLINTLGWWYLGGMVFDDRTAYATVSTWSGPRIEVLDFQDPSRPKLLDMTPEWGLPVLSEDRLFLIGRHEASVHTLEKGLPISGSIGPFGVAEKLLFDGDLGVLGDGLAGMVVFDFANPDEPVELGRIEVGGWVDDIAIADGFAFLAADDAGFVVVDYRDPTHPVVVWQQVFPEADDVALDGQLALVASRSRQPYGNAWLEVFDVADAETPTHRASVAGYQQSGNTTVVATDGIAYFGSGDHVLVIDLSDPTDPEILSTVRLISQGLSDPIGDLAISGSRLLAACYSIGLVVIDIADPSTPYVEFTIDESAWVVSASGDAVYSDLGGRISAIDLADPVEPTWRSLSNLRGMWAITPWRERLYLASPPYIEVLSLECEPPEAAFEWRTHGRMVWFTNTTHSWWDEIEWHMGDGTVVEDERNPMYFYTSDGTYDVTLRVSGENGASLVTHSVTVAGSAAIEPAAPLGEVLR